jgi:hypothetical protein
MLCLLLLFAGMVDDSVLERAGEYYSTKAVSACTCNKTTVQNSSLNLKPLAEQPNSPPAKTLYNAYEFVFCKALKLACFTAGTPIETENGPQAIETIQPGDLVWCRDDDDPSAPLELKRVEQVFERWARVLEVNLPGGVSIGTTAEHPFWVVGKGWVWAGDLVPGDQLLGEDGQEVTVESIAQTEQFEKVYNLRVADNHTYFVGSDGWGFSVWVHNANYRRIFFNQNPSLNGKVVVHHRIEQQVLTKYKKLFTKEELNAIGNLRGIPKDLNNQLHNSFIRKAWNIFYKANPNPTARDIINYADGIDIIVGGHFLPNIGTRVLPGL